MDSFRSFFKRLFDLRPAVIDDCVFRLHYKLTFLILLALSTLVAWRQHFGPVISCYSRYGFPKEFLETYCYAQSTYKLKDAFEKQVGQGVPGVDSRSPSNKIYYSYYPWVSLVIFIQAILFLVPRHFWMYMESGKVEDMVKEVAKMDVGKEDLREDSLKCVTNRIRSELNHTWKYLASYGVAETLNVVNVIGQIFLMNVFLGGGFSDYGPQVAQFSDSTNATDPATRLFPRVADCELIVYGAAGILQRNSALCVLPINSLYAKIYAFLWFWFVLLSVASCLSLLHRLVFCFSPRYRILCLWCETSQVKTEDLREFVYKSSASDCFLICLLARSVGSVNFKDIMKSYLTPHRNAKVNEKEDMNYTKF